MDQRVQCPVCTLYLHNGMTLESHLDTHPKDQVIKALCSLSAKNTNALSRTPTPCNSERSYRSRTPATDDSVRWSNSRRSNESGYWRRTPSRNKSFSSSNVSRNCTPELKISGPSFENGSNNNSAEFSDCAVKSNKMPHAYSSNIQMASDFNQQYQFYPETQDESEIKYSRTSDYNIVDSSNQIFSYNMPVGSNLKLPSAVQSTNSKRGNDMMKILPKPNNMILKNIGGMRYMSPGMKPYSMMISGNMPVTEIFDQKAVPQPMANQFNHMSQEGITPNTTVVTQNSQIIYREMVHSVDGKPYISSVPHMLNANENLAQSSSMYQNVMVIDQYGNTSSMYNSPQSIISKTVNQVTLNDNMLHLPPNALNKSVSVTNDPNKTLVIEVGPIVANKLELPETNTSVTDSKLHTLPSTCKGLKILSNIKVEVPVQHHKNMINTVMDLTGSDESGYVQRASSPENILPDVEDKKHILLDECTQPSNSSNDSLISHSFSVIKNVGKNHTKDFKPDKMDVDFSDSCPVPDLICNEKPSISPCSELLDNSESSMDQITSTTNPDPLIKNDTTTNEDELGSHDLLTAKTDLTHYDQETESIFETKCQLLESNSELGDSASESCSRLSDSPLTESPRSPQSPRQDTIMKCQERVVRNPPKPRNIPLSLNNIFVKKHKKVLKIKNAKIPSSSFRSEEPKPSSSSTDIFFDNSIIKKSEDADDKINIIIDKKENCDKNEFDADTEEQSMDIEPIAPSTISHDGHSTNIDILHIKEEVNTSNEFSYEGDRSNNDIAPLETLRPINVITYGNMAADDFDDDSGHRELLDLETTTRNKQFVNMMSDNYFGDNIYADYFTPDRVEAFDAEKESNLCKGPEKQEVYEWGEPSEKRNEFVLPSFIHESYKIAESNGIDYDGMEGESKIGNIEYREEPDNKADVLSESRSEGEPPLNICADERMPPRGELSGQESNGDMESPWSGMYSEVAPTEPYDLIARESWVSDGSDVDASERRDNLEEELPYKCRCTLCGLKFASLKELRAHKSQEHAAPTCSTKTTYSRMITARTIKKEEKIEDNVLSGNILFETKASVETSVLQAYDVLTETKTSIQRLIKREKKKRRNFVCATCKVDQGNDVAFNEHLKKHPLECQTCGKRFYRRANLALHIKTHLGIKNYKCEVCQKRFITRQKLNEHRNIHTGQAPVKCTGCDETFRRYSNMVQHRDRHHLKKKAKVKDFVCHACGSVFHSRAKLLWHKETHDEKPKACLYCSDKFVHAASLTRHVRRMHNEYYLSDKLKGKVDNVNCPICKQVYLRTNLRAHLEIHSGKRPYHCVICNKSFTTKWNLKLHKWTHMSRSAKPYKCNLCKGAFVRHSEYVSHMNAHKSVRPYTCNYCGCQFIRKYNCQRHVREHEMAKKYVCKVPECGKSFHRSYYLSEHMKVHSGARPFACNICGKTSSNKSNHNKHVKIHHLRETIATEA